MMYGISAWVDGDERPEINCSGCVFLPVSRGMCIRLWSCRSELEEAWAPSRLESAA